MMRRIKQKVLSFVALLAAAPLVFAAGGGAVPFHFDANLGNQASLQRGAKLFMNYCSGCHSLEYMRYNRIAKDLGIPEDVMQENLIFSDARIYDRMDDAMPDKAAAWFGTAPPDLTLVTRSRGTDWVYSFLLSFYLDDATATGTNNLVLENTAMPHALWPLQGFQALKHDDAQSDEGQGGGHGASAEPDFKMVHSGQLDEEEYRQAVADLTNFLVYVGEPAKMVRYSLGFKVILFLLLFTLLAWLLKREYWRDVH